MADTTTPAHRKNNNFEYLQPGDRMGEGDTELILDILPPDLADEAFELLKEEVKWSTMAHRGT